MKTKQLQRNSRQHGGILVATLLTVIVIGIMVAGVLNLAVHEHRMEARATSWNAALPAAEAGVEEAMSQLQANGPGSAAGGLFGNLATAGWTSSGGVYSMQRTLNSNSYYQTSISSATPPVITSTGFFRAPLSQNYISRTVSITTTNNGLFVKGLIVKDGVTSNGNSVSADAFDSGDPLYSTNGMYIASKATDGGGIATLSSVANALNFGAGTIYGAVATGPGGSIPAALYVGDKAWLAANPTQHIQPGRVTTDMNASFPDVLAPYTSGLGLTQVKINAAGQTYPITSAVPGLTLVWYLTSGDYYINSGTLSGKVVVAGNARIYVTSSATVNFAPATDSISISNNASLQFYVGSATAALPNVSNPTGKAAKLQYFGLPTNTNITCTVNTDFIGVMYAPNAKITMGGNGTGSEQKIIGAVIGKSMFYNDTFSFHYDKALARTGLARGYLIASWSEL